MKKLAAAVALATGLALAPIGAADAATKAPARCIPHTKCVDHSKRPFCPATVPAIMCDPLNYIIRPRYVH